ncbi:MULTISPECIES: ABC transporter ATP-binding protein [Arthrobacter]|uniref:ABC-type quaternary amine transporter n=1 Tax=Arthrobacter oryzae TaxID=409290 RepID=A0A3N0BVH7_9MICC|nr:MULTISPECIES: ABC transporter ATP-binding protein [Arthrobacter]QYF90345.1 ABC transporter ATP-binding protein [Arthrobacter sp. PAMC25284]RNL52952.1 ABC transporter ATP-binding protein [Arthrobacter oryzae]
MSSALVIDGLSKSFPGSTTPVLTDVSLTVGAGSCTAILGPSGSGKSTLLRAVAGLDFPDAGRILLRGTDLAGISAERRGMAMVSQRPLLFPHLNVLDNVAFAATVRGVRKRAARADAGEFLDLVQLGGFGHRAVSALSGGQQQRVAIARALAARPSVLLLDEPFSALDQELRSSMHELLFRLRERLAPTILMVTHDRDEAAAVADRVAVLSGGRVLQHDPADRVYARPASLEVHRLMGGLNEVNGTVRNGVHYSALGDLALPEDTDWPDGPGVLVFRPESIGFPENPREGLPATVAATVTGLRTLGPRRLVTVSAAGVRLHAEAPWGRPLTVGDQIRLSLPLSARAVVAGEAQSTAARASGSSVSAVMVNSGASK